MFLDGSEHGHTHTRTYTGTHVLYHSPSPYKGGTSPIELYKVS